jgi:hypothetical protein
MASATAFAASMFMRRTSHFFSFFLQRIKRVQQRASLTCCRWWRRQRWGCQFGQVLVRMHALGAGSGQQDNAQRRLPGRWSGMERTCMSRPFVLHRVPPCLLGPKLPAVGSLPAPIASQERSPS